MKYSYCGQCDGAGRHDDESGPGCSECGDADWLDMLRSDIEVGEVMETDGFLWTSISRYSEYPSMLPEGSSVAKKMRLVVRVDIINHSYDKIEVYYLNATPGQISAIEAHLQAEQARMEGVEASEDEEEEAATDPHQCQGLVSGKCQGGICSDCDDWK